MILFWLYKILAVLQRHNTNSGQYSRAEQYLKVASRNLDSICNYLSLFYTLAVALFAVESGTSNGILDP